MDPITGMDPSHMAELADQADAPDWAKAAAIAICRSYGIKGICDFAYIANTIRAEFKRGDAA